MEKNEVGELSYTKCNHASPRGPKNYVIKSRREEMSTVPPNSLPSSAFSARVSLEMLLIRAAKQGLPEDSLQLKDHNGHVYVNVFHWSF